MTRRMTTTLAGLLAMTEGISPGSTATAVQKAMRGGTSVSGTATCECGRTISANKDRCKACNDKLEAK